MPHTAASIRSSATIVRPLMSRTRAERYTSPEGASRTNQAHTSTTTSEKSNVATMPLGEKAIVTTNSAANPPKTRILIRCNVTI
jgi:hypothetical protein